MTGGRKATVRPRRLRADSHARASIETLAGTAVGAGGSFLATIWVARGIGLHAFAAFGIGLAANSLIVQLCDAGIGVVAVADLAGSGDRPSVWTRLLRRRIISASVVTVLGAVLIPVVPSLRSYGATVVIGAAGGALASLSAFLVSSLQGMRRFRAGAWVTSILGLTRILAAILITGTHGSAAVEMIGYAVAAPALSSLLAAFLFFSGFRRQGPVSAPATSTGPGSREPHLQRNMTIIYVCAAILLNADVMLLTLFRGPHAVGVYVAAWRVGAGVLLLGTALSGALLPGALAGAGDLSGTARRLMRTGLTAGGALLLAAPAMTVAGLWILGRAGHGAGAPLALLLVAFAFQTWLVVFQLLYLAAGRSSVLVVTAVVEVVTMVAVTAGLSTLGAMAPALGHLAAALAGSGVLLAALRPTLGGDGHLRGVARLVARGPSAVGRSQ